MAFYKKHTAILSAQGCGWQNLTWFLRQQSSNNDETYNDKQNTKKRHLVAKEVSASSIRPLHQKIQSSQHGCHSALHTIQHLNLRAAASGDNSRENASCSHLQRVKQRRDALPGNTHFKSCMLCSSGRPVDSMRENSV